MEEIKTIDYFNGDYLKIISHEDKQLYIYRNEKINGKYCGKHREDGPAFMVYDNGFLVEEKYCVNGMTHRENGPAYTSYDRNGKPVLEEYIQNNVLHRYDGPARIEYFENGRNLEEYFINGNNIDSQKLPFKLDENLTEEEKMYLQMKFG